MGSTTFELVALSQTCDPITNTCGIGSLFNYEPCYAVGPGGGDMFESTYVIAERQLNKAMELFDDVDGYVEIAGPISFIHQAGGIRMPLRKTRRHLEVLANMHTLFFISSVCGHGEQDGDAR